MSNKYLISEEQLTKVAESSYNQAINDIVRLIQQGEVTACDLKEFKEKHSHNRSELLASKAVRDLFSPLTPLDDNAMETSIEQYIDAQAMVQNKDTQMRAFVSPHVTSLIRNDMFLEALDFVNSLPSSPTRMKEVASLTQEASDRGIDLGTLHERKAKKDHFEKHYYFIFPDDAHALLSVGEIIKNESQHGKESVFNVTDDMYNLNRKVSVTYSKLNDNFKIIELDANGKSLPTPEIVTSDKDEVVDSIRMAYSRLEA